MKQHSVSLKELEKIAKKYGGQLAEPNHPAFREASIIFSSRTPKQSQQKDSESEPQKKKPRIPLSVNDLLKEHSTDASDYLSILDTHIESPPVYIEEEAVMPGVRIPKYLPRNSEFVTMVEWPLRPGDSRVEAYFIGTNSARRHWFLMECTVDDLSPFKTKYLGRRAVAMVEMGQFEIQEAAVLLLKCAWQYEKETWKTPPFFMVSDSGLLDAAFTYEVADVVWPEPGRNK